MRKSSKKKERIKIDLIPKFRVNRIKQQKIYSSWKMSNFTKKWHNHTQITQFFPNYINLVVSFSMFREILIFIKVKPNLKILQILMSEFCLSS